VKGFMIFSSVALSLYMIAYLSLALAGIFYLVNKKKSSRRLSYGISWLLRISMLIRSFPILVITMLTHLFIEESSMQNLFTTENFGGVKVYFFRYEKLNRLQSLFSGASIFHIFLPHYYQIEENDNTKEGFKAITIRHEYGHFLQLAILGGWLYLFLIAIPSITNNLRDRKNKLKKDYYEYFWEAWADKLGGIIHIYVPNSQGGGGILRKIKVKTKN